VAAVSDGQALLERDAALDRIDQRLRCASAGGGSLLLLEGPAGIGKTRLVLAAVRRGRELGLTTLSARGSELERDFAYGLVRQLFDASLVRTSPPERAELVAGAAAPAARLFGVEAPHDEPDALLDPSFLRSCTVSTGCARTLADAVRCFWVSTMRIGPTRPRVGF
jgi:hypothetical protein